ncbi:MAG: DUF885 domain-containing protein [Acidobacteria bacterium]|nr:DUF885 domain-containing protein [Acidobacteriota bacterium]
MNRLMRSFGAAMIATSLAALEASGPSETERFHKLLDDDWAFTLEHSPLLATSVGEHRFDDRMPSVSKEELAAQERHLRSVAERLAAINRARLSGEDRVSHDVLSANVKDGLAALRFRTYRLPFNSDSGFHTDLLQLPDDMPLATVKDYENYIARLNAFPRYFDEQTARMKEGLADGFTQPRVTLEGYDGTASRQDVGAEESAFFAPFKSLPAAFPEADRARLLAAGRKAVETSVVPSYRRLAAFLREEYIPKARRTTGAFELPDGPAYYEYLVRHFTTLDVTPKAVHEIGLSEVARIRAEMDGVLKQVGWEKSFAEFLTFLRTDPRFYAKTPEELLTRAAWIAKRMDGKLPTLFGRLPRQPYGVAPVPEAIAPRYTGGRYVPAPLDSRQSGTYWVNTYDLPSRPFYTQEALTLHEAVPGHHLQIALSKELTGIPEFRRHSYVDAYGEGWGLYSERLGLEAGFYADPYSNFGRLTYEMWRACRLVVDTGIHAFGWNRQRVIDYLASNSALSLHECTTETDRYISWPGQALSYKIGELKIRELRARAEKELGERFDVRAFHDTVLGSGSLPLTALEAKVNGWIAETRKLAPSAP